VGSNVNNKLCATVVSDGTHSLSESLFTYDSHGNLLKTQLYNGSAWLYNPTNNSYNSNGTISTAYDLAGNATTFAYSSNTTIPCSAGGEPRAAPAMARRANTICWAGCLPRSMAAAGR
jgi:hypothetical protein